MQIDGTDVPFAPSISDNFLSRSNWLQFLFIQGIDGRSL